MTILKSLSNYDVTQIFNETDRILFARAISKKDKKSVIIKLLKRNTQRSRDSERFRNAHNIGVRLNSLAVKPIALEFEPEGMIQVLDDDGSEPLLYQINKINSLSSFLKLATQIVEVVSRMHALGIIHCDLRPMNIFRHPISGEIKLVGFELAMFLTKEQQISANLMLVEASLQYMSPEQTGKVNQAVDIRSDLYTLGIIFYQIWLGRLPFQADDALGWIYNHLTVPAPSLFNLKPKTPVVLSDIIQKLLEKDPLNRYKSAAGLNHDLTKSLNLVTPDQTIPNFELGESDISDLFQIPHKLYGREKEINQLLNAFDRFTKSGKSELILVSGYSGVGKSSLIRELQKPLIKKRGYYLSGKFDQYKKGIPYSTLAQALQGFVLELLVGPKDQLATWKQKITTAVGVNAKLLVDLIPELTLVIGEQKNIPEVDFIEAENRFRFVISQFISVFANEQNPMVLVLDDLQWADAASLKLIQDILTRQSVKYLFVIGAYRDNEVLQLHPLKLMVNSLHQEHVAVTELVLNSLSYDHLAQLIADLLHRAVKDIEPLAHVVYSKTTGNPFFFIQFLISLYQEDNIYFDRQKNEWNWKLNLIREKKYADNVVDLLLERLRKLSLSTQNTLALAACIGSSFSFEILSLVEESSEDQIRENLWYCLNEGLILHTQTEYKFLHDRVQQAAMALFSSEQKAHAHLNIGRKLWESTADSNLTERIFDIVSQMNHGLIYLTDKIEITKLANLNYKAAKLAQQAAAYEPALVYLSAGLSLINEAAWSENYELAYGLYLESARCEYLSKNFDAAELKLNILLKNCRHRVELAEAYSIGIQLYSNQANLKRALDLAFEFFKLYNLNLTHDFTFSDIDEAVKKVFIAMNDRPIDSLVDGVKSTDLDQKALLSVITITIPAAFVTNKNLWAILVCHGVLVCLKHGHSEDSALAYSTFSLVLASFFKRYQDGYKFGLVALNLAHQYPREAVNAAVYATLGGITNPWIKPFKEGTPLIKQGHQVGADNGNLTWACYSLNLLIPNLLAEGVSLGDVWKEAVISCDYINRVKFYAQANGIVTNQLFIQWMRGGNEIDETQHLANLAAIQWPIEMCFFYFRQLQANFLFGKYKEALAAAENAAPLLWTTTSLMQTTEYALFYGLTLLQLNRKEDALNIVKEFQEWSSHCPENYSDKYHLLLAEVARVEKRTLDAEHLYEKAIQETKNNGFTHMEALCYELASVFYRERDFSITADAYMQEARACYLRWDALEKVNQIDKKYQLNRSSTFEEFDEKADSFSKNLHDLDVLSVIKASQNISEKIQQSDLSKTLLSVAMESAAADKGCLIISDQSNFSIAAIGTSDQSGIQVQLLQQLLSADSDYVPEDIVQYAARTKKQVLLIDATTNPEAFSKSVYLQKFKPRAVLCLPIRLQTQIIGYLYLENSSVAGVFTHDKLFVLELIASQAAISLENARLLSLAQGARHIAEKEQLKQTFLTKVGNALTESLNYEQVIDRLAKLLVTNISDWCYFDMIEDDKIVRRSGMHKDYSYQHILDELAVKYAPSWDSSHAAILVLKSKEPLLVREISDSTLAKHAIDQRHTEILKILDVGSSVVIPLQTSRRLLGVMTIANSRRSLKFDENSLALMIEVAKHASMAIENSLLYRETQKAVQLRDDFISIASHELRTPLTPLKMQIEIIKRSLQDVAVEVDKTTKLNKMLSGADRQIERLAILVEDMLDVSRMTSGTTKLNIQKVDLAKLVYAVIDQHRPEFEKYNTQVSVNVPDSLIGEWDDKRIEQVIINLITNAIKYGRGEPIEISLSQISDKVVFSVKDHGIGISKEDQSKVFGRFVRVVSVKNYGGLGLGLYIVRQIIDAHHGEIHIESDLGQGATFTVTLPLTTRA